MGGLSDLTGGVTGVLDSVLGLGGKATKDRANQAIALARQQAEERKKWAGGQLTSLTGDINSQRNALNQFMTDAASISPVDAGYVASQREAANKNFASQADSMSAELAAKGFRPGDAAYDKAMGSLSANQSAVLSGISQQARDTALNNLYRQYGTQNSALQGIFGQNLTAGNFYDQAVNGANNQMMSAYNAATASAANQQSANTQLWGSLIGAGASAMKMF